MPTVRHARIHGAPAQPSTSQASARISHARVDGGPVMYRDVVQWSGIRRRILREGVSISQVVRETGISRKTVRKMLNQPLPEPYGPRDRRYPKLGPHTTSVQRAARQSG